MGEITSISWCHHTFNLVWGCIRVSEACAHCYAAGLSARAGFNVWGPGTERRTFNLKHWNQPRRWDKLAAKEGVRRRVFCASMADVFEDHPTLSIEREKLWKLIEATPNLDWLLLTKRPENFERFVPESWRLAWPQNAWAGTTVELQRHADNRLPYLARVPARVRFVSCEPLLGDLNLKPWLETGVLQLVVAGGESGRSARAGNPNWYRSLRDQTLATPGVSWHFKQWGEWHPDPVSVLPDSTKFLLSAHAPKSKLLKVVDGHLMYRVGKKAAGHVLDGIVLRQVPQIISQ